MFEHLRQHLEAQLAQAQSVLTQAQSALSAADAQLTTLETQLSDASSALATAQAAQAQAQSAANSANSALAAANGLFAQRATARNAAAAVLDDAKAELADIIREFPHGGPLLLAAERKVQQAQQAYNATAQPLAAAQAAVGSAQTTANAANAALQNAQAATAAAQQRRDQGQSAVASEEQTVAQLTAQRDQAQHAVDAVSAQIAPLDARAARILAEPLNRPDLEQAADAELAALSGLRQQRAGFYAQRAAAITDRVVTLEAQDQIADQLAQLIGALTSWNAGIAQGHYPAVTPIIASLQGVVDASHAQRTAPHPSARTDDLAAAEQALTTSLAGLHAVLAQAQAEQSDAAGKLAAAAQALADWQEDLA